jgi:penicillin amidase
VLYDQDGVPHIYGDSETDLSYGPGWADGRDRLFQITFRKHAAQGRLSELLNDPELLSADQFLRILTFDLQRQIDALSDRDRTLIEAYAAGVNQGAAEIGNNTAELTILGFTPEPFTLFDSMSILRAMTDGQMASGLNDELARQRVLNRLEADDPRVAELFIDLGVLGPPIVATEEHSDLLSARSAPRTSTRVTTELAPKTHTLAPTPTKPGRARPAKRVRAKAPVPSFDTNWSGILRSLFVGAQDGASNSWAVHGSKTASGKAFLANDPHMEHEGPGLWEMVHLERDGWKVAGGTIAGLPGVVIGYSDKVAWGLTNATMDCGDLLAIRPGESDDSKYMLDGVETEYGEVTQTYKLGKDDDAEVFTETWKTTVFGPMIPPGYDFRFDEGAHYALQTCLIYHGEAAGQMVSSIWDFPVAETPLDIVTAVDRFAQLPMSLAFVLANGDIVYRNSGTNPQRPIGARYDRARPGESLADGWQGLTDVADKPLLINPAKGYYIASNQRVLEADHPANSDYGWSADTGERAQRIDDLLGELFEAGKPTADELYAIQQDLHSIEAERLAPVLAANCPSSLSGYEERHIKPLCDSLADFDNQFTVDTLGGLAFAYTLTHLREEVLAAALGDEIRELPRPTTWNVAFMKQNIERALLAEHGGEQRAIFDDLDTSDREGIEGFMARALPRTIDRLIEEIGDDPIAWRWGRVHKLEFKGALAAAPVIGGLFSTGITEQPGHKNVVRAESSKITTGDFAAPVTFGAALRLRAEAGDGVVSGRMILDNGNSGHFGHEHMHNMHDRWHVGETIDVLVARDEVHRRIYGWAKLMPK